jgi:hypothetical protein
MASIDAEATTSGLNSAYSHENPKTSSSSSSLLHVSKGLAGMLSSLVLALRATSLVVAVTLAWAFFDSPTSLFAWHPAGMVRENKKRSERVNGFNECRVQ